MDEALLVDLELEFLVEALGHLGTNAIGHRAWLVHKGTPTLRPTWANRGTPCKRKIAGL